MAGQERQARLVPRQQAELAQRAHVVGAAKRARPSVPGRARGRGEEEEEEEEEGPKGALNAYMCFSKT